MAMIDPTAVQTLTLTGERFVILPEAEYLRLLGEEAEPTLPAPDDKGRYPAVETARVILARKLIRARRAIRARRVMWARRLMRPRRLMRAWRAMRAWRVMWARRVMLPAFQGWFAPTLLTASAWRIARPRGRFIASWAWCYVSAFKVGMQPC